MFKKSTLLFLSLFLIPSIQLAQAARQPMPVSQRLENLRGNRKIDPTLSRALSKSAVISRPKKKSRTMLASTQLSQEILISPVSGWGVEGRYQRLMSQLHRRKIQVVDAGIRKGHGEILVRINTTEQRDDLVDILYRSQNLIQTAKLPPKKIRTRYANLR